MYQPQFSPEPRRVLPYPDLKNRKGIAWSRAHRMIKAGKFPKPLKLGEGTQCGLRKRSTAG